MTCTFCRREDAATTERGLKRHQTMCKENPANSAQGDSVADRVRKYADAKLAEAEQIVRKLSNGSNDASEAVAAFERYHELMGLLEAP